MHSTLAELVTIANEAGVPTGGKAWMPISRADELKTRDFEHPYLGK